MRIKEGYIKIKNKNIPDAFDEKAVYALIERVAGKTYADAVTLCYEPSDGFDICEVSDGGKGIVIKGNSALSCAAGFNAYLKERCGYVVGALSESGNIPKNPPAVGEPIKRTSAFLYRYFFNYCTFGYTLAFDGWKEWEKTLDYLILNGYNLILNPVGVECVWKKTLSDIGYSADDAKKFLCGPAFYPWQWMLNLSGWAGGAPESWYKFREELAGKINERIQSFGAAVAGVGYVGAVPADMKKYFPEAKVYDQGKWFGFERPAILDPDEKLYDRIVDAYYINYKKIVGADRIRYFAGDPFHEGGRSDGIDLAKYGKLNLSTL